MTGTETAEILNQLEAAGQHQFVAHWSQADAESQQQLAAQLASVDLPLFAAQLTKLTNPDAGAATEPAEAKSRRATGPGQVVRLPESDSDRQHLAAAKERGESLMREGRVGAILVAGGQGSRLGFEHPKGLYPIGPISNHSLFQILCEQLRARSKRAGQTIPYFVMTSHITHEPTVEYFQANDYFGLSREDVYFFQQGNMPAVDSQTHQILLSRPSEIQLSPDGHGGLLQALSKAGLFSVMAERGIDTLYYHQVDNPTATVCDPVFLGLHDQYGSLASTKVVAKRTPQEKMGAVVDVDGTTQIIEYSDLPDELAEARDSEGAPIFWAGSTAIHVFDRDFLESLATGDTSLPFHVACKNVPYMDVDGVLQEPNDAEHPNAIKFERFIFDCLPSAKTALVVEAERSQEFNPVKNADGDDSPATSRAALVALHRQWLTLAGHQIPEGAEIEISPLVGLSPDDLAGVALPTLTASSKVYLSSDA